MTALKAPTGTEVCGCDLGGGAQEGRISVGDHRLGGNISELRPMPNLRLHVAAEMTDSLRQ